MQTLVAAIFVFGILVLAHELGHYLAARLTGIRVLELAIGFGPKIMSWRKNKIDYSLRLLPLGGFCRMLGENPEEVNEPGNFTKKPIFHRAVVLAAGAFMNLLLAVLVFFVIFFFLIGVPQTSVSRIGTVFSGSPAELAGLQSGDEIVSIENKPVQRWEDVVAAIEPRPGETVRIVARRDGEIKELFPTIAAVPETGKGMIGITPVVQKYHFTGSVATSFNRFGSVILSMYQVITGQAPLDVAGPVGIIIIVGEVAQTGFVNLLWLTAVISISLGLINLLPVPALDGGRLLFLLVEAVRGRPVDPEKEGFIHFIGFALLILLILLVTYNDLIRWDILPWR
ncbi:MAG: RIP metalloprotease RseP [Bacillota bacterium]